MGYIYFIGEKKKRKIREVRSLFVVVQLEISVVIKEQVFDYNFVYDIIFMLKLRKQYKYWKKVIIEGQVVLECKEEYDFLRILLYFLFFGNGY